MIKPERGLYYHYKHDRSKGINNYAYEVLGVGHHTEADGVFFVVYLPLYESAGVYKAGKYFDVRPLEMFMEKVNKEGKEIERFTKITDPHIITELKKIKVQMYGQPVI